MRKHVRVMGFVLVALFAMSCFAPPTNAVIRHGDLMIYIRIDGTNLTSEDPYIASTAHTAYELATGANCVVQIDIVNYGEPVTVRSVKVTHYRVYRAWEFDQEWLVKLAEYGPLSLDYTIPTGEARMVRFGIIASNTPGLYATFALLEFDTLDDLTIRIYTDITEEEGGVCLGTLLIAFVSVATLVSYSIKLRQKRKKL